MHKAKNDPENQAQTAVAGPPAANGEAQVADTAYDQKRAPRIITQHLT